MGPEARLAALGIQLPSPPAPGGAYRPTVQSGKQLFIAAQFPIDGDRRIVGRLGGELGVAEGRAAARMAALNVLAQCRTALGTLDAVARIIRVDGHMLTTPEFDQHARVLDGASELFNEIFGDAPGHVRALSGHASLPLGLAIELVTIAEIAGD